MKKQLAEFYLDWVNNYLTVSAMADAYGIEERECVTLIDMGRKYYELLTKH